MSGSSAIGPDRRHRPSAGDTAWPCHVGTSSPARVGAAALAGLGACTACTPTRTARTPRRRQSGRAAHACRREGQSRQGHRHPDFAFWGGSDGETAGFNYAKQQFEEANPATKINLKVVPVRRVLLRHRPRHHRRQRRRTSSASTTRRSASTSQGRRAARRDAVLRPETRSTAFLPALWDAIKYNGIPYGVPHQTDTTCIVYNKTAFATAGITSVPDKLADAWTWDEFSGGRDKLRSTLPGQQVPVRLRLDRRPARSAGSRGSTRRAARCSPPTCRSARCPATQRTKAMDLHEELLRQEVGAGEQHHQDQHLLGQLLPEPDRADDLRRRLPGARNSPTRRPGTRAATGARRTCRRTRARRPTSAATRSSR